MRMLLGASSDREERHDRADGERDGRRARGLERARDRDLGDAELVAHVRAELVVRHELLGDEARQPGSTPRPRRSWRARAARPGGSPRAPRPRPAGRPPRRRAASSPRCTRRPPSTSRPPTRPGEPGGDHRRARDGSRPRRRSRGSRSRRCRRWRRAPRPATSRRGGSCAPRSRAADTATPARYRHAPRLACRPHRCSQPSFASGGDHARSRHRRHRPHARSAGPTRARSSTCRPDDLAALDRRGACSTRCPQLDPPTVEDVIWGCGAAGRRGRATTSAASSRILAGHATCPGVTVNRYCSSSLQTIRMAAHAIKAGEGDVFVAGGVETVSRFQYGAADTGPPNAKFAEAEARTKARSRGRPAAVDAADRACPTSTSRWARPPRTSPSSRTSTREEMDEFAALSQQRAVDVAGERLLRAGDHAGHARPTARSSRKDDGPRAGTTVEKLADAEAGVPARRRRSPPATRAR